MVATNKLNNSYTQITAEKSGSAATVSVFPQWSSHRGSDDVQPSQLHLCKT